MINRKQKQEVENLVNSSNIIAKGSTVNGNIETFGNIRIEGKIIGDVKSKSKVAFGASAQVQGNILAQNVEIAGHIKGIVEVAELLILKETAIIEGDIITNKLLIETGAIFNGKCKMGSQTREIKIGKIIEEKYKSN